MCSRSSHCGVDAEQTKRRRETSRCLVNALLVIYNNTQERDRGKCCIVAIARDSICKSSDSDHKNA